MYVFAYANYLTQSELPVQGKGTTLKIRLIPLLVIIILFAITSSFAKDATNPTTGTRDIMPISEIKRGMKGYGVSAFGNNELQRFDVEILGVMENTFAGMDLILARLSGPQFKQMGVIAGMSGSPVYINDKIIGAVSYGDLFSMEPIAGITPIEKMLEIYDRTDMKPHPDECAPVKDFLSEGKSANEPAPLLSKPSSFTVETDTMPGFGSLSPPLPKSITMQPLSTPLIVSGCSPRTLKRISNYFRNTSLMPVMGGAAHSVDPRLADKPMENGSAIAIPLISGSIEMAAIGTVTYRKDNKLVAFGHPFFEMGNVDVPMANAYIFTIVPSYYWSFKMGASVREVGSIRQDRLPAIGGIFGMKASSFDIDVNLSISGTQKKLHYHLWENEYFSSILAEIVIGSSIMDNDKYYGNSAAKIHYIVTLSDGTTIEKRDFLSTRMLAYDVTFPITYDLHTLMRNTYRKVDISNIKCDIDIIDQYKIVEISSARLDKEVYKPGEKVKATIYFMPFRQPRFSRNLEIELPDDIRDGTYNLEILDADGRMRTEVMRSPGLSNVLSFEGLVKLLRLNYPTNQLYVLLTERKPGIRLKETEMPELPQSVMTATRSATAQAFVTPITMSFIREKTLETDFEINGRQTLQLRVDHMGRR